MADKGHHHAHDSHYHVVFPVKYRKALLTKEIPLAIVNVARGIEERYEIEFEKIGTDLNHIHILCSFSPSKYKGGDVVRIFKSITARELFKRFPELKVDSNGSSALSRQNPYIFSQNTCAPSFPTCFILPSFSSSSKYLVAVASDIPSIILTCSLVSD